MIQCPSCRSMIPDDSAFCDQCGKELMWCPECKRPKRGTQCPVCGNDLVPGSKYLSGAPSSGPSPSGPDKSVMPGSDRASRLVGPGMVLTLQAGAFGRRGGIWQDLSTCQYVSGNHGVIGRDANGWTIMDVGSTNGTKVNGQRLQANVPVSIKIGDKIKIATLEFTVE